MLSRGGTGGEWDMTGLALTLGWDGMGWDDLVDKSKKRNGGKHKSR